MYCVFFFHKFFVIFDSKTFPASRHTENLTNVKQHTPAQTSFYSVTCLFPAGLFPRRYFPRWTFPLCLFAPYVCSSHVLSPLGLFHYCSFPAGFFSEVNTYNLGLKVHVDFEFLLDSSIEAFKSKKQV